MATFVRMPPNNSATPTLRTIGDAVGAGNTTEGMLDSEPCVTAMGVLLSLNAR